MLHRFHPKPTYWLLVCLLAVVVTVATSAPPALAQSTYSRLGYKNYVINYGSYALMDRPASNTSTGVSWQLLISYVYVGQGAWLVQSGMGSKSTYKGCPSDNNFHAFAEYIGQNTNGYQGECFPNATVNGQNSVYNQTNNASTPYWCMGINSSPCLKWVYERDHGMTNATYVAAYGETTVPTAIMANKSPNWAYIRKVSYKATRGGEINNPITKASTTVYENLCTADATGQCPYRYEGFDEQFSGTSFLTVRTQTK